MSLFTCSVPIATTNKDEREITNIPTAEEEERKNNTTRQNGLVCSVFNRRFNSLLIFSAFGPLNMIRNSNDQ